MKKETNNQGTPLFHKHSVSGSSFSNHKIIKIKLKKIVRLLILCSLTLYLVYCFCHFLLTETRPTYFDCGNVVSKSSNEVVIKNRSIINFYLIIQFEKSGYRSIQCNPTTYFSKNIGEKACFYLYKEMGSFYNLNNLIGMFIAVLLSFAAFMTLVCSITSYLFWQ